MTRFSLLLSLILILAMTSVIVAGDGAIDEKLLEQFEQKFDQTPNQQVIINAVTNNKINDLALDREKVINHDKLLSLKLKSTDITDQESSGRCWAFAGVSIYSPEVMNKLQLPNFEMSESFLAFYDKLEKSNFFLERVIELRDKPLDNRSLQGELEYVFGDGGWWTYFLDLTKKYGIVPKDIMPETKQSSATGTVNNLGKTLLRKDAAQLRRMYKEEGKNVKELRKKKEEMMAEVYQLLVYNYGKPPKEFTWRYEYKDKDDTTKTEKQIIEKTYTPESFFSEFIGDSLPEFVSLVNIPTKEYNKLYQLEASRNIYESPDFRVVNLPIEKLKEYAEKSLLDSQAVWFACDVGKDNYRNDAIMRNDVYDYNNTLNINFTMSKKDRIAYGDITPNHAMVLTGVDTTSAGAPRKWLVKNSWGTKLGDKGYWYMYDDWFDQYVFQVVIDKNMLSDEDKALFDQKPVMVKDWEPFFLALRNIE